MVVKRVSPRAACLPSAGARCLVAVVERTTTGRAIATNHFSRLRGSQQGYRSQPGSRCSIAVGNSGDLSQANNVRPVILTGVQPEMAVCQEDIFAPLLSMIEVSDDHHAIRWLTIVVMHWAPRVRSSGANACSSQSFASSLCYDQRHYRATADPRVSFGGRGASGYGVTRGWKACAN